MGRELKVEFGQITGDNVEQVRTQPVYCYHRILSCMGLSHQLSV